MRDKLTALAFGGGKVVTSDLLANYEIEGEPVEQPGDISILLDSDERPVAMIEDVRSIVIRLADMTDEDAIDEGEGYADAAAFRVSHEDHWNAFIDEVRDGLGDPTFTITDDTPIVVERFRIAAIVGTDGSPIEPRVRPAYPPDRPAVDAFLAEHNADVVARRGELVDARTLPALIVESDGVIAGVLTWVLDGTSMEVLTLHAAHQWEGAGSALLAAARRVAEASGAHRLWLITTNDNVDALRFYQRRGYRLARVDAGAVDRSRAALKPAIPEVGAHGIPLRDELELELLLGRCTRVDVHADAPTLLALELALARRDEAAIPGGYEAVLAPDFLGDRLERPPAGPAPRSSRRSTRNPRTRRSRSSPSRPPISGQTWCSPAMTLTASRQAARSVEAAAARSGFAKTTAGSSASTRARRSHATRASAAT